MKKTPWIWLGLVVVLAFALTISTVCKKQEIKEQQEKSEVELPAGVVAAVEANFPDAKIDFIEVIEESGISLYDIEFKDDAGEIEVAADGTIIDIVTIIKAEDLPEAAAEVFRQAAEGATIRRYEKSEIWNEIKQEEGIGKLVKLDSPKYVYEAEVVKGTQTGEIEVDADGQIIEPLKWDTEISEEKKK